MKHNTIMPHRLFWTAGVILALCACSNQRTSFSETPATSTSAPTTKKVRTIVTTDGEVDDVDSFIRLLLYSNDMDIVGLVYSSSQWHYKGDGNGTLFTSEMDYTAKRYGERTELRWPGMQWMQKYIGEYAKVYENLKQHDGNYPSPEKMLSIIRVGNIDFEGEMSKNSPGSDLIKSILLDADSTPVYLQIWGGTSTVARALKSIEDEFSEKAEWNSIAKKISDKAIIYAVLDQDATYRKYVSQKWPNIKVFYNSDQFWSFAYFWPRVVPTELQSYLDGEWFSKNIIADHGPLLASYFTWGDGRQIEGDPEHTHGSLDEAKKFKRQQYDFISEGDSPAYLFLLDVGLRSTEDPSYGGWGGRLVRSSQNPRRWEDGKLVTDYNPSTKKEETTYPQVRWINVIQNDFAARADWCVKSYDSANHHPIVSIEGNPNISAKPGDKIIVQAKAKDPDNNKLNFVWWHYKEAGSYPQQIDLTNNQNSDLSFTIPPDAKLGQTIHVILQVTDDGTPNLTRYQRVIITIS
jgi:hypothetical protein